MNVRRDDEDEAPAAADPAGKEDPGKRKIGAVDPEARQHGFRCWTSSFAQVSDRFGDVGALSLDKFGALRYAERPSVNRRVQRAAESSVGSHTPLENTRVEGGKANCQYKGAGEAAATTQAANDSTVSTWGKYIDGDWANEGTSHAGNIVQADPPSHSSVPLACTLHERTPTRGGPTSPQFGVLTSSSEEQEVDKSQEVAARLHHELAGLVAAAAELLHNESPEPGSLPRALPIDHCSRTGTPDPIAAQLRYNYHCHGPASGTLPPRRSSPPRSSPLYESEAATRNRDQQRPRFAHMGSSSEDPARRHFDQHPVRITYRFAPPELEASLIQRMEARQRVQDKAEGVERVCGHVISPEDLIWGSVKHYCGMVLDRETRALLGTAILFMPPDNQHSTQPPSERKPDRATGASSSSSSSAAAGSGPGPGCGSGSGSGSRQHPQAATAAALFAGATAAWVTCVKVVEGRTEVLIKNSKGNIHVAQLLLTSTTLGVALFSVHVWQGTFALAFLSRVAGPASLPHRLFVDVDRSDRVYVIGYEEPWELEAGMTIADVRVRPGRVVDAGRHEIVEIDFSNGRLGGSILTPSGFRGGLVVRADGLFAGVVTGQALARHPTNIDFASAFNVYSLLGEL